MDSKDYDHWNYGCISYDSHGVTGSCNEKNWNCQASMVIIYAQECGSATSDDSDNTHNIGRMRG